VKIILLIMTLCFVLVGWKCSDDKKAEESATSEAGDKTGAVVKDAKPVPPGDEGDAVWLDAEESEGDGEDSGDGEGSPGPEPSSSGSDDD
jgi:hypothetical protein